MSEAREREEAAEVGDAADRPNGYAWRLLALLTGLNVLNFVDRTLIGSLGPLLLRDPGLTRAQIGLLAGLGFVVFYSVFGLFLGFAADRWRRMPLLAAGLALWSAMTAVSGWARSFAGLAIPRLFVGVGEATLAPTAISMLGDAFAPRRLATAMGIYYAGIPLGTAASLVASSYLAPRFGWRSCFFVLGAIGLVAAVLLPFCREPERQGSGRSAATTWASLVRDLRAAFGERRELGLAILAGTLLVFGSGAAILVVTWLVEERGYDYSRAALLAGLVAVGAGLAGNLAGGAFGDAWARSRARSRSGSHLASLIPMTVFFVPVSLLFYTLEPGSPLFAVCWFLACAGTTAWFGPLFAAIQELSPAGTRASVVGVTLLVMNVGGVGLGTLFTGWMGDVRSLETGLVASQAAVALAIVPLALAARSLRSSDRAG
jgi:predicted MFS family arabinose efflux permease